MLAIANGIRSLANPGSTPEMKRLELPCCAASSMGAMYLSGMTPHGYWKTPGDVPTTLTPAVRMRRTSVTASGIRLSPIAQYTAQSGSVASRASRSLVAAMPVEASSPASSPASLPTLASEDTQTPVSSNRGSLIRWLSAIRPTLPVPICATRIAIAVSSRPRLDSCPTYRMRPAANKAGHGRALVICRALDPRDQLECRTVVQHSSWRHYASRRRRPR